jgi:hypothetical protein
MDFYRGDLQAGHPAFAEGSEAAAQQSGTPVDTSAPMIVYSKKDDDAIDEFHRHSGSYTTLNFELALNFCYLVETTWHSVCEQVILSITRYLLHRISRLEPVR